MAKHNIRGEVSSESRFIVCGNETKWAMMIVVEWKEKVEEE